MSRILISDAEIRKLLETTKTIAVVGISDRENRPSFGVADYLATAGYEVIPVNPKLNEWMGMKAYPTVESIGRHVDMVDVFRQPRFLSDAIDDAISAKAGSVWTQFGVIDDESTDRAVSAGIPTVIDKCVKIEHARLLASDGVSQ